MNAHPEPKTRRFCIAKRANNELLPAFHALNRRIFNLGLTHSELPGMSLRYFLISVIIFLLSGCVFYQTDNGLTLFKPYYMNRERAVSTEDLKILEMTTNLLSDEGKWKREDDRLCFYKEKWSLFCALAKASVEITGKYKHRRVVMQEIRFTINDHFPERWKQHQLMEFNNHPSTTFEDIKRVLRNAKKHLEHRYKDNGLSKSNSR